MTDHMSGDEHVPQTPPPPQVPWWSIPPGERPAPSVPPIAPPMNGKRKGKQRSLGLSATLSVALIAGAAGGAVGFSVADRAGSGASLTQVSTSIQRAPGSVADLAARVLPSVVSISVKSSTGAGTGSGFVIRSDGYILTNNHVVATAANGTGTLTVQFQNGQSMPARIIGRSATYDLAVIKINQTGLTALPLGDSDKAVVGDSVIAIGAPLGLAGTVTTGIISAKNRAVTAGEDGGESSYINALQTDAAINPGNSGGPLVDSAGAVIGVNSAIATLGSAFGGQSGSIGLGFAIPINQARRVADQLIATGKATHPIMGIAVDQRYTGEGARIATSTFGSVAPITPGGPADKAGLRAGDVIIEFNGKVVNSADELIVAIRDRSPGDVVSVKYKRGSSIGTTKVTLAEGQP